MPNVKILADSTCDLTDDLVRRYNIHVIPLYVTLGDKSLLDGVQAKPRDLYEYFERTKKTPKTSAATVGDFVNAFEPYVKAGDEIVFVGISEAMSACVDNARAAAREFPGHPIACVDSMSLSTGVGMVTIKACELAEEGKNAAQIAAELKEYVSRVRASFVLDTLAYLYHGGRCSAVQNIGSMLLKIKPRIQVINGAMTPTEKFRGGFVSVARQYAQSVLKDAKEKFEPRRVFVTSSADTDQAAIDAALEEINNLHFFEEVIQTQAGCVITSHCGSNTVGILYVEK